jgi:hypothetical protein
MAALTGSFRERELVCSQELAIAERAAAQLQQRLERSLADAAGSSTRIDAQVCGLKLLMYEALSYWCMKP